ncbi:MAG: serine hydrolase, partial [Flavobacteriales bacterium]|nr:serine hydrolase [Flavobacteriales bacterium]
MKNIIRYTTCSLLFLIIVGFLNPSDKDLSKDVLYPPFLSGQSAWSDSVFKTLSPDERIAQLFMVAAYSNKGPEHVAAITQLVEKHKIGGLIFFQGGPVRQARLTNLYQSKAKVPLMIAMDAEWGLAMRLDSTVQFPYQMTLGAIQDNQLIYQMGKRVALQSRRLGVHINFAPVVDINNNRNNPVINYRSFGEDRKNVSDKGLAYMKGMQDQHVLANAKHFPGHGDTDTDSHLGLPLIPHGIKRLDSLELYPFKKLINQGLGSMMIAHLYIPVYDSTRNLASTLSKPIVTGLLRDSLKFQGLIFTDALNMKGVSKYYEPGIVDVKAVLAGNDVLLFSEDVPRAMAEIKKAIKGKALSQGDIDKRCMKILRAKEWFYLDDIQTVKDSNLINDLNTFSDELLKRKLIESSLTLLRNKDGIIPITGLDTLRIATLSIGKRSPEFTAFQRMLENYAPMKHYSVGRNPTGNDYAFLSKRLEKFDLILTSIHSNTYSPKRNYGLSDKALRLINLIRKGPGKVIITAFSSPYALSSINHLNTLDGVLVAYNNNTMAQELSAQLLFGGVEAKGRLPVTIDKNYPVGFGLDTRSTRIKYTIPEELGIDRHMLDTIDSIAMNAIREKATPGCQVFVMKENKVIYWKSFGYHTYDKKQEVRNSDIYDLASITKTIATTASIMKLSDENKLSVDSTLGTYLSGAIDTSNKDTLVLRAILSHYAQLKAWIPFWLETVENVKWSKKKQKFLIGGAAYKEDYYSKDSSETHPLRVADNLYLTKTYIDSIMNEIIASPLNGKKEYIYSDLGYYFLMNIVDSLTGSPIDKYAMETFYKPLGLKTMGFKPRKRFTQNRVVPTENDYYFRKQLVNGDVHDPGAAMMGGVGGHAGAFSNAQDLGVFMTMLLNGGVYGGRNYISDSTIKEFTTC